MPALDQCQPQMIRAFDKAGWNVGRNPASLRIDRVERRYVFVDLLLQNRSDNSTIIIIEIKCFADERLFLDEFYSALGQYAVYRSALVMNNINAPLYLAVSSEAYNAQFHKEIVQSTLDAIQVKVVVIDLDHEEIVQWNA
jgi:Holliday junction resolvase